MNTLILVMILLTTSMNSYCEVVDARFLDENLMRMQLKEISSAVVTINVAQNLKQESDRENLLEGTLRTLKHSSEKNVSLMSFIRPSK